VRGDIEMQYCTTDRWNAWQLNAAPVVVANRGAKGTYKFGILRATCRAKSSACDEPSTRSKGPSVELNDNRDQEV